MIIDWFCVILLFSGFVYATKTDMKKFYGNKTVLVLHAIVGVYLIFILVFQKEFYIGYAEVKFGRVASGELHLKKYLNNRPREKWIRALTHYDNGYYKAKDILKKKNS